MEGRSVATGGILLLVLSVIRLGFERGAVAGPLVEEEEDDLPRLLEETRVAREEVSRRTKPLGSGEKLDPNRSGERDLDRLPGVGPVVAAAWVQERMANGGFAASQDLLRIPGIGPGTLAKLEPYLDFSQGVPLDLRRFTAQGREGVGSRRSPPRLDGAGETASPRVNINRASLLELQTLPGIGSILAERVLRSRIEDGPFRSPADLLRVPGIGPSILSRLESRISVGG